MVNNTASANQKASANSTTNSTPNTSTVDKTSPAIAAAESAPVETREEETTPQSTTLLTSIDPLPEAIRNINVPFQATTQPSRWQWKLAVSTLFEKETPAFLNWGAGVVVRRKMTRRLALQSGLAWHHLARSRNLGPQGRISATNFAEKSYVAGAPDENDLRGFNANSLADLNDFLFRDAPMPNLNYLVVPLLTSLKVTDNLSINTGLNTAFLVSNLFTKQNSENLNLTIMDVSPSAEQHELNSTPGDIDRTRQFILNRVRQFDLAVQVGVNLQLNAKLGIHLDYHHGFRDISINQELGFQQAHNNRYFNVGLNFNLSNHRGL